MIAFRLSPRRARILLWALLVVLLASLAVNVALFRAFKYCYTRELSVRLRPAGGNGVTHAGNPAGSRVLFLGDSRAAEWPPLPADRFFTSNAGGPGETSAQILLRAEGILLAEKPSVVIVQAGINDLKAIGVLPGQAAQLQRQCAGNLAEIVKLCRRHNASVVLTLILPAGPVPLTRRVFWSDQIQIAVHDVNQTLARQFAATGGVTILDLEKILDSGRRDSSDYRDTLHLTPAAYARLEPGLLQLLDHLPPPQASP
jgi:lysophospholipase L1-like esterase